MVAHDSSSALFAITGEPHSNSYQQSCRTRRVIFEVKQVDTSVSGPVWYTLSSKCSEGKIKSGKSTGFFGTKHEIVMSEDDELVFKLKHSRSLLQRNATVGSFTTNLRNRDESIPLVNAEGKVVANVHVSMDCTAAVQPTFELSARPWIKDGPTIKREFDVSGHQDRVSVHYYSGMHVFAVAHGASRVAGRREEDGRSWTVMESDSKCMTLSCNEECSEFSLSGGEYTLAKGNLFEACDVAGTWTLCKGKAAVGLINVAGPFVSCCRAADVPVAAALANAMYASCVLTPRVWAAIVDGAVAARSRASKFVSGGAEVAPSAGFRVAGGASGLAGSLKQGGAGSNAWVAEHKFLAANLAGQGRCGQAGPTLASEMGWGAVLGLVA